MGPLEGVKVIDLSAVVSGPLTGALLADQGADVIKVERTTGDIQRNVGSRRNGYSGSFHVLNRGKRSIALDLQREEGVSIVKTLARSADVVIQNFRPGVVQRLGIDHEVLSRDNPGLVYLSISGFGQTGPESGKRAYDPIIQNFSGISQVQGQKRGEGPEQVNQLILDKLTAYNGLQAITAALFARHGTQRGQHIELSMLDSAVAFMWPDSGADLILEGEDIDHHPPIGSGGLLVQAKDGWVAMVTLSDHEFSGLCNTFGLTDIAEDPRFSTLQARQRHKDLFSSLIKQQIQEAAADMEVDNLLATLTREQVPHARVRNFADLPDEPQCQANNLFRDREHPVAGQLREARPAPLFSDTALEATDFAPTIGQHTREIMTEYGLGDLTEALLERRVLAVSE